MGSPSSSLVDELEAVLGGSVTDLRRLSGGASRITSAATWSDDDGVARRIVVQQARGDGAAQGGMASLQAALLRAAGARGVPVPEVLAGGGGDGLDPNVLVMSWVDGEALARRILRDEEYEAARRTLTRQCAHALVRIHEIDPDDIEGLPDRDPFEAPTEFLDLLGLKRPVLDLAVRWLDRHRPAPTPNVVVHGDFRLGNLLVDHQGLSSVLDWELAHRGDPAEDLGWLCAPAWRFGGPGEVGGFGDSDELLAAYHELGGVAVDRSTLRWWQVYGTLKWAIICALQASAHLSGATRSVELATIGRRVCECEHDLLALLGVLEGDRAELPHAPPTPRAPFGRPSASELVEAVREQLDRQMASASDSRERFEARVARNALQIVERELDLGPRALVAHEELCAMLHVSDEAELSEALRAGRYDDDLEQVARALVPVVTAEVLIANPGYLEPR